MSNNNPQITYIHSNIQQGGQVPQNNVIYVTVPPQTSQQPQRSSKVNISSKSHRCMAILEFFTVCVLFILEVIALFVKNDVAVLGTGIWFVVFIFVTGLLGYYGAVKNSECLIISCMIMAIITCCLAIGALSAYSIELIDLKDRNIFSIYPKCHGCSVFIQIKNIIGEVASVFIFILTIVQSSFCCKDVCSCCRRGPTQSGVIFVPQQQQPVVVQLQQTHPYGYSVPQSNVYPEQQQQIISHQPSHVYQTPTTNDFSHPSQDPVREDLPPTYLEVIAHQNGDPLIKF